MFLLNPFISLVNGDEVGATTAGDDGCLEEQRLLKTAVTKTQAEDQPVDTTLTHHALGKPVISSGKRRRPTTRRPFQQHVSDGSADVKKDEQRLHSTTFLNCQDCAQLINCVIFCAIVYFKLDFQRQYILLGPILIIKEIRALRNNARRHEALA